MFLDALATASAVASTDLMPIDQNGTLGVGGASTTRAITAGQFMILAYPAWIASLPTSTAGLAVGDWYLFQGVPTQVPAVPTGNFSTDFSTDFA